VGSAREDDVSIVGVGTVGFGNFSGESSLDLANRAVEAALDDAGLTRDAIDGLLTQIGSPRGIDYDSAAKALGITAAFCSQTWSHGRFAATLIQYARMAILAEQANAVLCLAVYKNSAFSKIGTSGFPGFIEGMRDGGGPHAETYWAGLAAPSGGAGLSWRRYLHTYGVDGDDLGRVAIQQREWAGMNPLAVRQTPIDQQEYLASPYVVEPLRRLDCSSMIDTAVAVIIARGSQARDLKNRPVTILGAQGLRGGVDEFVFGLPGLGIGQASQYRHQPEPEILNIFATSGRSQEDINAFYCYDGFAPQVPWTLERFGFCAAGEGLDFIGADRGSSKIPFNTNGGHLSEGHSNGWGQTMEIVNQLRGQAGERQIPDCTTAMWATTFGDAVVYGI